MESKSFQFLLDGKNCSRRGVRMKAIGPTAREDASLSVAREMPSGATAIEYSIRLQTELLKRSMVAVTKQESIPDSDALLALPETAWTPLNLQILADEKTSLDAFFTAKDFLILKGITGQMYDVEAKDVDTIMGKALTLSGG